MDNSRLNPGSIPLNVTKRKFLDRGFAAVYLLLLLVVFGFTCFGAAKADFPAIMSSAQTNCGMFAPPSPPAGLLGLEEGEEGEKSEFSDDVTVIRERWYYTLCMILVLIVVGAGWLTALCHCAKPLVYATVALIPISWFAGAAVTAYAGSPPTAAICFALGLLTLLWIWCIRRKLDLTAALIQEATHVLSTHPSLVAAALGILFVFLVLFVVLCTALVLLVGTGRWETDAAGECAFVLPMASKAGLGLTTLAILWSTLLAFTLRFFAVSFVTACWYFSPNQEVALQPSPEVPANPTRRGLFLGLSSSFGTLCFSAAVGTVCAILNNMARNGMRSRNLLVVMAACCLKCILALIEFVNKFAVSYHAVTGAAFCTSAKEISGTLAKNALSVYIVDRIGGFVLHFSAWVLSALIAGATTVMVASTLPPSTDDAQRVPLLVAYGAGSYLLAASTLQFLATILLNIVDAAYTCHALDLESNMCHQPKMKAAIMGVVSPTAVVQQPGGAPPVVAVPAPPQPVPGVPYGYAVSP
eukprot:Transcript_5058.p1 GENE.Transcript_5058~~Transcript_5058.p1  ORF type:complete len:527 (-),score=222.02 Transcript_5058:215-1795(-)